MATNVAPEIGLVHICISADDLSESEAGSDSDIEPPPMPAGFWNPPKIQLKKRDMQRYIDKQKQRGVVTGPEALFLQNMFLGALFCGTKMRHIHIRAPKQTLRTNLASVFGNLSGFSQIDSYMFRNPNTQELWVEQFMKLATKATHRCGHLQEDEKTEWLGVCGWTTKYHEFELSAGTQMCHRSSTRDCTKIVLGE